MKQMQLQDQIPEQTVQAAVLNSRRVPLEHKIILKFHHFGGFFVEYSANMSLTGMFIKTDTPKPAGSIFIFEVWLGDEYKLVHGVGEVVWVRRDEESGNRPPGMGIRYLKLDDESRAVVERVIAEHVEKGGEVFELGDPAASMDSEEDDGLEKQTELALVEEESRPISHSDLLVLDEDLLGFDSPAPQDLPLPQVVRDGNRSHWRGLRIALLLMVLAAVMGGAAYLVSADLISF